MADSARAAWSMVTPTLLFASFCLLVGELLFGYDTATFGGILANPGFVNQFGEHDAESDTYDFTSTQTSLLSSLAFIGKFIGCLIAGPLIEKFGHRTVLVILSVVSVLGVIVEITAADSSPGSGRLAQFIIGRIIVYTSVGLVEVDATTYQSEIVPAPFRGFVIVSLQLSINAAGIMASGLNKAFSSYTGPLGWKTVTGIQLVFPALIMIFTFFLPTSPRWLISKDRYEDAVRSLSRLRPKSYVEEGRCEMEIQEIRDALHEEVHKGPWKDLVRGKNLQRTILVLVNYFFQQTTGQAFASTYQTTFYKKNGYAKEAFTYPIINSSLSVVSSLLGMYLVDQIGRRDLLMVSFVLQALWMYILAGIGSKVDKTSTENNVVVAAFMLFAFFYNMGGAAVPYVLGTEIPNASLREKTQALGTSWNVIWAFVTNYIIPYLIDNIHFQVGWVFGSVSLVALVYTFLCLPETKGLALEEVDAIFESNSSPFRLGQFRMTDANPPIAGLTGGPGDSTIKVDGKTSTDGNKPEVAHV